MNDLQKTPILQDLAEFLAIESTEDAPAKNAPFGLGLRKTLDWFLNKAASYGLSVSEYNGYYGIVELGKGDKMFGVLCHLDTVGVGEGWSVEPFALTQKDGYLYGRGIVDNKGVAVVMLHVLKKLKDTQAKLNHRVRLIVGCNEETGSKCLKEYALREEIPLFSIVPDADFPVVASEKGILHLKLKHKVDNAFSKRVKELHFGGSHANVIPDSASVVLDNQNAVEFKGRAGHAMAPEMADNAAWKMFKLLDSSLDSSTAQSVYHLFCNPDAKANLGIDYSDTQSGDLTMCLTIGALRDNKLHLTLDMRLPICADKNTVIANIKDRFACEIEILDFKPNLFFEEDSKFIKTLCDIYKKETGQALPPVRMGGGTYARELPNAVAFGPTFPNTQTYIHDKDERVSIAHFNKWFSIYYNALLTLDKL